MTLPALLFGFLLSTAYGALFHFWKGGGAGRLLIYLALAWIGFALGQYVGEFFNLSVARLGPLHIGLATLFSLVFLFVGDWLTRDPAQKTAI
jgi:hypothetical protein